MIATLLAALALASGPTPLPDHPITGKPVRPTWSYWHETVNVTGFYRLLCWEDAPTQTRQCFVIGYTRRGAVAALRGYGPTLTRVAP